MNPTLLLGALFVSVVEIRQCHCKFIAIVLFGCSKVNVLDSCMVLYGVNDFIV